MILLLAVGNSFPHTHASDDTGNHHAERPHVHVGVSHHSHVEPHHHHGHEEFESDQSEQPTDEYPFDHDSDAIYLSGGQFFLPSSVDSTVEVRLDCVAFVATNHRLGSWDCQPDLTGYEQPIRIGPPLFLLHAALRL